MTGFLNINKPAGLTSFAVVKQVKAKLPKMKIGHLGTLDPMATGVLPLALGSATRLIEWVDDDSKTYRTTMILGATSDTQDQWGNLQPTGKSACTEKALRETLPMFQGEVFQIPPMYSAVHHQGKRLYELARKGIEVEREARPVLIRRLELLDFFQDEAGQSNIALEVDCSAGTYIRTLCHDIGQTLGTGAYLSALERTRWGPFRLDSSFVLAQMEDWEQKVISATRVVNLPHYRLNEEESREIEHGRSISIQGTNPFTSNYVLLLTPTDTPFAVAEFVEQKILQPKKVFH